VERTPETGAGLMRIWKNTNTLDGYFPPLLEMAPAAQAEIVVIGSKPVNLDQFPLLKGIFKCGIGVENVPFAECEARGIAVGLPGPATAEIIFEETANFTVYTILRSLYSAIGEIDGWIKYDRPSLSKRTVLIVGLGNIGGRVRDKLGKLVNVTGFDIKDQQEGELPTLLANADVVSLHMPLTGQTKGWFDRDKLALMRDNAVLVNTSRGQIVVEDALLAEIQAGRLRAAFDVFWTEPYTGPLRAYHPAQFLMTPHVASTCTDFLTGLAGDLGRFIAELETNGRE